MKLGSSGQEGSAVDDQHHHHHHKKNIGCPLLRLEESHQPLPQPIQSQASDSSHQASTSPVRPAQVDPVWWEAAPLGWQTVYFPGLWEHYTLRSNNSDTTCATTETRCAKLIPTCANYFSVPHFTVHLNCICLCLSLVECVRVNVRKRFSSFNYSTNALQMFNKPLWLGVRTFICSLLNISWALKFSTSRLGWCQLINLQKVLSTLQVDHPNKVIPINILHRCGHIRILSFYLSDWMPSSVPLTTKALHSKRSPGHWGVFLYTLRGRETVR